MRARSRVGPSCRSVLDEFHPDHQSAASYLTDRRVFLEGALEERHQPHALLGARGDQVLVLQDAQHLAGHGGAENRVRVGEAVDEALARCRSPSRRPVRCPRRRRTANSRWSSPWRLRGCRAGRPNGRGRTSAPSDRTRHHLVGDEQDTVAGTDLRRSRASSRPVARPPRASPDDRLGDERRDATRTASRMAASSSAASASTITERTGPGVTGAVRVGRRYVAEPPSHGFVRARAAGGAGSRARRSCSVVAALARDQHVRSGSPRDRW
jgi:hypothetical protein